MANDRFLAMFFEEARELLQALEAGLVDLEARQQDRAHLDRTFRAAHTLKGAAGMVGLRPIAEFTHGVETVLGQIRDSKLAVRPDVITTLLQARDHLDAAVEAAVSGQTLAPPEDLVARLSTLSELPGTTTPPPAVPEPAPTPATTPEPEPVSAPSANRFYRITLIPVPDLLRQGVNPVGFLNELRELGRVSVAADWRRVPPLVELNPTDCYLVWTVGLETSADLARLEEVFLLLKDRSQVTIEPVEALGVITTEPPPLVAPAPVPATVPEARPKAVPAARLRVDAGQLDELLGLAGELAILTDSLQGLRDLGTAAPWAGTLEALERLGRRLRDTTLELRMVPIEELFARFPRVVRDLADRSGKQVHLQIKGEDTRLDRTIIERLAEPMIHMIRNAIDHGLGTPETRQTAGKSPTGTLTIGAGYEGDRVVIQIADDGRGLDRAKIARKGVALGLLPAEVAPEDARVGNLIFEPGFSTAEKVGELSGRGVGLDVVRDTIRSLRGSVTIRSTEGQGTTFLIHLPLTLALIDGLLVEVNDGHYVVPMTQVEECVALSADDPAWTMHRQAVIVRGELIPLIPMRRAFGATERILPRQELLLTQHAEQRVGVVVDNLLGRVQTVIQPLDEGLAAYRHFSGATILGDGAICLIVDLATIVRQARPSYDS